LVDAAHRIAIALNRYAKGGAGFSDQMIALAGIGAGCEVTVTFDRKAAQGPGM
jgi:predicted nucleic-acid-binding protein